MQSYTWQLASSQGRSHGTGNVAKHAIMDGIKLKKFHELPARLWPMLVCPSALSGIPCSKNFSSLNISRPRRRSHMRLLTHMQGHLLREATMRSKLWLLAHGHSVGLIYNNIKEHMGALNFLHLPSRLQTSFSRKIGPYVYAYLNSWCHGQCDLLMCSHVGETGSS